jgi:hypothetical protein
MFILGLGIGLAMQVLTIVVQNTCDYKDLGVATSGVTFLRTMGSAFGAAIFGSLYANQLTPKLAAAVVVTGTDPRVATTPQGVHSLPPETRAVFVHVYAEAIQYAFRFAVPVALLAFVVAFMLKQVPMRGLAKEAAKDFGQGFGMPDQRTSAEQLESQLVRILRTRLPDAMHDIVVASGADLDMVRVWTVRQVAIEQHRVAQTLPEGTEAIASPVQIAWRRRLPLGLIAPALDDARDAGLIEEREGGVVLSALGKEDFRAVIRQVIRWIITTIERESGEQLSDEDRHAIATLARKLALQDDAGALARAGT